MAQEFTPITTEEYETLESFLFSDAVSETALDSVGLHGLLTATILSPVSTNTESLHEVIFDGTPRWEDDQQKLQIDALLKKLVDTLHNELYSDQEFELPCPLTLETDSDDELAELTIWAQGFMEGLFLNEPDWFAKEEETVAEMLLPIMVASELFDEPDIADIRKDPDLAEEMAEQIPELLVDLFLFYHAPDK